MELRNFRRGRHLYSAARPSRCTSAHILVPSVLGRPFVKRFAICYRTVVCPASPVLSDCYVGVSWPNGWMDQDATWYGGRSRPRRHGVRWRPSFPNEKGHSTPRPTFRPISTVAKRSPISATAELLLHFLLIVNCFILSIS